jgi:hypothetical protein
VSESWDFGVGGHGSPCLDALPEGAPTGYLEDSLRISTSIRETQLLEISLLMVFDSAYFTLVSGLNLPTG